MTRPRLHAAVSKLRETWQTVVPAPLAGRAYDRQQAVAAQRPLRGAVFSIEQLEVHARALAAAHQLGQRSWNERLRERLTESERVIARSHDLTSSAHSAGVRVTPIAEWLLDNHHLINEQIALATKYLPRGHARQLPRLAGGDHPGLPRVYGLVLGLVAHVDGRVDEEALRRYLAAYQSVTHLEMGELWAVPTMLRLAILEILAEAAEDTILQREHRDYALSWVRRIDASSEEQDSALIVLVDMVRDDPPLSTAFVTQFTQALTGRGATTAFALTWLEQRLAARGLTIDEVVRAEVQCQANDQALMANCIASLRLVGAVDWHELVEDTSATEAILKGDPAGAYGSMDFETRDQYRHAVEATARRLGLDEQEVARTAVALAAEHHAARPTDAAAHVGYTLVDDGRPHLDRALLGRERAALRSARVVRRLRLLAYLGPVALLATAGAAWLLMPSRQLPMWALPVLALGAVVAASQCALSLVNWVTSLVRRPRALPRMDFEEGIPATSRTVVVVPTLLLDVEHVARIIESLELRYLANRDTNLWFALLTDFGDAPTEHLEGDGALLAAAADGVELLNRKYDSDAHGQFFLLHRPRLNNPQEGCWMGRERKRGKLEDFNALLCGQDRDSFDRTVGDVSRLTSVRYVITLDTDTDLPWGAGWRLVGAASHPLNRPQIDEASRRLVAGYAILQPRVSVSLRSAAQSHYSRLLAGDVGIDPYTRVVSDVYQDLFSETSYIGKGIYDVEAFRHTLDGRFPDNTVLSHDLLESCFARAGQVSDVELLEETPSSYLADIARRHRWMRGDWQLLPWLGLRVSDASGRRLYTSLDGLGRWRIFDNLRRALVTPAYTLLLVAGWIAVPNSLAWTAAVLSLLFLPELLPGLVEVARRPPKLPRSAHLLGTAQATARRLVKVALWLTFLPFEAWVAVDAAARALWRAHVSHRHRLEWQTAAAAERAAALDLARTYRRMWVGPALAVTVAVTLVVMGARTALTAAAPILVLWLSSPWVAWWISRPRRTAAAQLGADDVGELRRYARLTWRYFEVFVGPQDNWLPPDNVQGDSDEPGRRIAHRTSPTDMALALLANLSAHDMGYLSVGQLLDRTAQTIESMERLKRVRGHFLNWYDTRTRRPLLPLYVSTVDSGNLVGHVRVLRSGLLELPERPIWSAQAVTGLRDTLRGLTEISRQNEALDSIERLLLFQTDSLAANAAWLRELADESARMVERYERDRVQHPEAAWWAHAFDRQVGALLTDLTTMAPWLAAGAHPPEGRAAGPLADLDGARSLRELGNLALRAADALADDPGPQAGHDDGDLGSGRTEADLRLGVSRVSERLRQIDVLAERCTDLAQAEFGFLYDAQRKHFAIGFWVEERRLDGSFYDLLASEARLASYLAIATGQVPFEHWFALGRRLTVAHGRQMLLSWSGSMFEYLMPLLVMPEFRDTLLDRTCRGVVARQIEYGNQQGTPWGISESCYDVTDSEGTHQYRAFGVPGLGLQRGLGEHLVISPYATALALLVDPPRALANLRRMATAEYLGPYGFYEAIDFTGGRATDGRPGAVIPTVMAHHHGMTLLALSQTVLGPLMQRRFLANADLRAATLLLQERIPKAAVFQVLPPTRPPPPSARHVDREPQPAARLLTNPNSPVPEVQLLSNGRYHVTVSAAGGGYSRWDDLAVTRWREDPTAESHGVFCFISDPVTDHVWSTAFQPTLRAGGRHEAIFSPGRVELRRQDDDITTQTEIAVSPDDDVEIRRVRLTNHAERPRNLVVTSYAEVVLAPNASDELHRAFSNLFVQAEIVPECNAILMTRRPRASDEEPPWMFAMMRSSQASVGQPVACSYETDRARFIGRGRSLRHPVALDDGAPLSGSAGDTGDPCVALRLPVRLAIDRTAQIDLVIGAAPTREAAMALVSRYQDPRMADRALEAAATHAGAIAAHLQVGQADVRRYEELASAVIFPVGAFRASKSVLRRNRKGQSGLWGYAISGDRPIVLLHVSDVEKLALVRDLLRAHALWRMRGLSTDLVIWNESASGYRRELDEQILELIAAGTEAQFVDRPGGVFLRQIDSFPEEDRVLLQAVARIVIWDAGGPLEQQLARWKRAVVAPRPPMIPVARRASRRATRRPTSQRAREDLIFANGTGGFTQDGREYVVELPPGHHTPAPWVNVIANPRLGTVVSESGSAYTWYGNAQLFRLTPWGDDAVGDHGGEGLFVRSEPSGRAFSPTPWPGTSGEGYTCRHGFGYSAFEHSEGSLDTRLTTYVAVEEPVKFLVLHLTNHSTRRRALSVLMSMDLVLGNLRSRQGMHIVTELEPLTGAIIARNSYGSEGADAVAFLNCSESRRSVSGDRAEVLGRNGDPSAPAGLRLRHLSGRLGPGLDPCAAMLVPVSLAPGATREIVFILGAGRDTAEAVAILQRYRTVAASRVALEEVWRFWNEKLGVLHVSTPDRAMDVLVNGWLPYQALSCRMWGRSGFYQSGGAYGFRDQLQDCMALLHEAPEIARQHILRCAAQQFVEGDVQHWWHPPSGRGVRTSCSDDYLWLPYAVARYVAFTGDTDVLDEPVPFLVGRALEEGEDSYYDLPGRSDEVGSLYQHCTRAISHSARRGAHGLPLMGSGDWNDGMNRVAHLGRGESVWLGFFLHHVTSSFATLAARRGDAAFAEECQTTAQQLERQIETHAWDGQWYKRAWFDDEQPLGSAENSECAIDSLPQSWATIAGVGSARRREEALDSMWEQLVRQDLQVMPLFAPPFDDSALDPGYIKGYPPGVRENGGQYNHAAVWAAWALALAGRSDQAASLMSMINPIDRARDTAAVQRYAVEPYALAADIRTRPPHTGRGGWTWYTGSAAWLYRLMHEVIFGIEREADTLFFRPRVPASWTHFTVHYRYFGTFYHIELTRDPDHHRQSILTLDGKPLPDNSLHLIDDHLEHHVTVLFGPNARSTDTTRGRPFPHPSP